MNERTEYGTKKWMNKKTKQNMNPKNEWIKEESINNQRMNELRNKIWNQRMNK